MTVTRQGLLRLEIKSEKSGDVPIKGRAKMLGMSPEKSIKTSPNGPVPVEKDLGAGNRALDGIRVL